MSACIAKDHPAPRNGCGDDAAGGGAVDGSAAVPAGSSASGSDGPSCSSNWAAAWTVCSSKSAWLHQLPKWDDFLLVFCQCLVTLRGGIHYAMAWTSRRKLPELRDDELHSVVATVDLFFFKHLAVTAQLLHQSLFPGYENHPGLTFQVTLL